MELKVNGETIDTFDIDPTVIDHVLVNEVHKFPVVGGAVDLTVRVVPKSARDYEYLAAVRGDAFGEAEKEIAKMVTPQDNPVAVALEKEFGAQPVGTILPTDAEIRGTDSEDRPQGSVELAEAAGDEAAADAMQQSEDADGGYVGETPGEDEAPIQAFESEEFPTTDQEGYTDVAEEGGPTN